MKLGQSESKAGSNVMKFECEVFSCFPEEKETLFFGGDTELRIKGIMQWVGKWMHYDKFMDSINALNRMLKGLSLKDQAIWNKIKTQYWMNCIIQDILQCHLAQSDDADIPQYVRDLVEYQMTSTPHVRLNWNEMKSGYEWMRSILNLDDELLNISNIAVLLSDCSSITMIVDDAVELEESEWESVVNALADIREMGLSMNLRFEFSLIEYRQDEMYMMAQGYLEEEESKWLCRRNGNVFTFSLSDDATSNEQDAFRKRTESMIRHLSETVAQQKMIVDDLNKKSKEKKDRLKRKREAKQKSETEKKEEKQDEHLTWNQQHDPKANSTDAIQQIPQGSNKKEQSALFDDNNDNFPLVDDKDDDIYIDGQNEEKQTESRIKTEDVWRCTVCTFWNNLLLTQCELCGANKSHDAMIVQVQCILFWDVKIDKSFDGCNECISDVS